MLQKKIKKNISKIWHLQAVQKYVPSKFYIKLQYRNFLGDRLDLKKPSLFSEKIQWLKLFDKNPENKKYVDKYQVRDYIKKTIGERYLIPLLGIYQKYDDIDFDSLPNNFVLKPTHTSGDVFIVKNKNEINYKKLENEVKKWLSRNYYLVHRERPYNNIEPKIICEKFLEQNNSTSLTDYKFYCFNGKPEYCQVIRDRNTLETIDFYDLEWTHMEFTGMHRPKKSFPHSKRIHSKPKNYEEMVEIAEKLAKGFKFIRIDLYSVGEKVFFGEITFYPLSGLGVFDPPEWNKILGDKIKLPTDLLSN